MCLYSPLFLLLGPEALSVRQTFLTYFALLSPLHLLTRLTDCQRRVRKISLLHWNSRQTTPCPFGHVRHGKKSWLIKTNEMKRREKGRVEINSPMFLLLPSSHLCSFTLLALLVIIPRLSTPFLFIPYSLLISVIQHSRSSYSLLHRISLHPSFTTHRSES